jgi:hypothetical protein
MVVNIINFGDMLLSRPTGREAFLLARADEFITGIKSTWEYRACLALS